MNCEGNPCSDSENSIDPEEDAREDHAAKLRKKAGLPQIDVDTVPSTIATKMLNPDLDLQYQVFVFISIMFFLANLLSWISPANFFPIGSKTLTKELLDETGDQVAGRPGQIQGGREVVAVASVELRLKYT